MTVTNKTVILNMLKTYLDILADLIDGTENPPDTCLPLAQHALFINSTNDINGLVLTEAALTQIILWAENPAHDVPVPIDDGQIMLYDMTMPDNRPSIKNTAQEAYQVLQAIRKETKQE